VKTKAENFVVNGQEETALARAHPGIAALPPAPAATAEICCVPRSCPRMLPQPFCPTTRLEC